MLFNTKPYNTGLYNGGQTIAAVFSTDVLVFDDFSLSDGTVMVMEDVVVSGATRDLIGGKVPRGDGFYVTDDQFGEYAVEAWGIVKRATAALLDAELDVIRKRLRRRERFLDYTQADGTVKRFVATLVNYPELLAGREHYHITFHPWRAKFIARGPFPTSRGYSSVSEDVTSSPHNLQVYHAGTARAKPVVTLNFTAASSVTAVRVTNTTTGEYAEYAASVAANDVLVFDSEQVRVTKNGTKVAFSGALPLMEPEGNLFTIAVTASSFAAHATVAHKETFL